MSHTLDPFDDLASLYLTDADADPRGAARDRETTPAEVEVIVAGHLPVRGGLWLAPYADSVARRLGTTALLRLDHGTPIVQVYRGPGDGEHERDVRTWRAALRSVAPWTRRWIVRPPHDTPAEQLLMTQPDHITILSSADNVAVVEAYRVIRELVSAANRTESELPAMGVAVIGASDDAARRMIDGLNRTARAFLGLELPLVGTVARMDADLRLTDDLHVEEPATPDLNEVTETLDELRESTGTLRPVADFPSREEAARPGPAAAPAPPPVVPPPLPRKTIPRKLPPRQPAPTPPPLEPVASSAGTWLRENRQGVARQIPMKLPPKRESITETKPAGEESTAPAREGRPVPLAGHVEGLQAIEIRMPGHERIELAFDGDGKLHLLGRDEDVRVLGLVRSWAWAHRELLAAACLALRLRTIRDVVPHLFAESPLDVDDLHAGEIQLHVLAAVQVDGQTGWYSAPLNRPATWT